MDLNKGITRRGRTLRGRRRRLPTDPVSPPHPTGSDRYGPDHHTGSLQSNPKSRCITGSSRETFGSSVRPLPRTKGPFVPWDSSRPSLPVSASSPASSSPPLEPGTLTSRVPPPSCGTPFSRPFPLNRVRRRRTRVKSTLLGGLSAHSRHVRKDSRTIHKYLTKHSSSKKPSSNPFHTIILEKEVQGEPGEGGTGDPRPVGTSVVDKR